MDSITIGGVPEHFNLPWHLAIENNKFEKEFIKLKWLDFKGGTGEMCLALRVGSIDMALVLTEGIIKDISNGNPSKIVKIYIASPLLWGVHVHANSTLINLRELKNKKVAISRFGSGSQLMAKVNATALGFQIDKANFEIVQDLDGGIKAIVNGTADYFL
jgi:ABC-type nitrate/sulfonate/bicarbonate transport system substrate-binding protein